MPASRVIAVMAVVLILLAGLFFAWSSRAELPPAEVATARFDAATVKRGRDLAALGDCITCHTAPDGKAFAGGRALETPFGTIYGTNITPDRETGIGTWSETAFMRAMRDGVDRDGNHLYPAFPYDHFTRATEEDLRAIYAYLLTVDPVTARPPQNELRFPFNVRPLLAAWKALFLDRRPFAPVPGQSDEWNRGAYLVTGLAHCGACHTPRNALGAEKREQSMAGGEAEGWHAPALDAASPSPVPWTADTLYAYLRNGIAPRHGAAGGPMTDVTRNLATVPEQDVRAMAVYLASLGAARSSERPTAERGDEQRPSRIPDPADRVAQRGQEVYAGACASCHDQGRSGFYRGAMSLRLSSAVHAPTPANLVQIVVSGIVPPDGAVGTWMPAFGTGLNDEQLVALVHYLRTTIAREPAWREVDRSIREARAKAAL